MLSRRIIKLRKELGISQAQLANALHISPSTEGMYEQGRRIPGLNILVAMAGMFDVSLDYLITGKEYERRGEKINMIQEDCPCSICYWKNCYDDI